MKSRPYITLRAETVSVTFRWHVDRYQHTIKTDGAKDKAAKLASIDSIEHDTPVYTEIHRQDDILFLSGNGGTKYWSASVEVAGDGIMFDVACRVKAEGPIAAATYQGSGLQIESAAEEPASVRVECEGEQWLVSTAEKNVKPATTATFRYRIATASGAR